MKPNADYASLHTIALPPKIKTLKRKYENKKKEAFMGSRAWHL